MQKRRLPISTTDHLPAPAFYWTAALILGLIAMSLVTESAPVKLRGR